MCFFFHPFLTGSSLTENPAYGIVLFSRFFIFRRQRLREDSVKSHSLLTSGAGMDALIIACKQHPTNLLLSLIKYLAPSRPFAVFSPYKEPLLHAYMAVKDTKRALMVTLSGKTSCVSNKMRLSNYLTHSYFCSKYCFFLTTICFLRVLAAEPSNPSRTQSPRGSHVWWRRLHSLRDLRRRLQRRDHRLLRNSRSEWRREKKAIQEINDSISYHLPENLLLQAVIYNE